MKTIIIRGLGGWSIRERRLGWGCWRVPPRLLLQEGDIQVISHLSFFVKRILLTAANWVRQYVVKAKY